MLGYTRRHLFIALATIFCIAGISWVALAYFFHRRLRNLQLPDLSPEVTTNA